MILGFWRGTWVCSRSREGFLRQCLTEVSGEQLAQACGVTKGPNSATSIGCLPRVPLTKHWVCSGVVRFTGKSYRRSFRENPQVIVALLSSHVQKTVQVTGRGVVLSGLPQPGRAFCLPECALGHLVTPGPRADWLP